MATPIAPPKYIYKLLPSSAAPPSLIPSELPPALPVSSLDQRSGFVHLSTAKQVLGTLVHFFSSEPHVYILRLPYTVLMDQGKITWESPDGKICGPRPGEGLFPHLYNGLKVGQEEVDAIAKWEKGAQGWKDGAGSWQAGEKAWKKEVFFGEEEV